LSIGCIYHNVPFLEYPVVISHSMNAFFSPPRVLIVATFA